MNRGKTSLFPHAQDTSGGFLRLLLSSGLLLLLAVGPGCNSYKVQVLPYDATLKEVSIIRNDYVKIRDFEDILADEFGRHQITARILSPNYQPQSNEYVVTYEAKNSWAIVPFLADATVRIHKDGVQVGKGHYHHIGRAFSLDIFTKWLGGKWKMHRLFQRLLHDYPLEKPACEATTNNGANR